MAICYWDAKLLWDARLRGISFASTITIGHLSLYLHSEELAYFQREYHSRYPQSNFDPLANYSFGDYSDDFLTGYLGVKEKIVMDASTYEGADTVHDLNLPVPETLVDAFDVVIDNGSLEHIFNFPTAISNLMKMVKVGGSIFLSTPANNLCGHGFFQFSPELMFRIFTEENGYQLERVLVVETLFPSVEMSSHREAFEVTDPKSVRSRVGLVTKGPVTMMVEARKIGQEELFKKYPIQSDYVDLWNHNKEVESFTSLWKQILRSIFRSLPIKTRLFLSGIRQRYAFSLANKKHFRKV